MWSGIRPAPPLTYIMRSHRWSRHTDTPSPPGPEVSSPAVGPPQRFVNGELLRRVKALETTGQALTRRCEVSGGGEGGKDGRGGW